MDELLTHECLWLQGGSEPEMPYCVAQATNPRWFTLMKNAPRRIIDTGSLDDLPRLLKRCEQLNAQTDLSLDATIAEIKRIMATNATENSK